MFILFKTYIDVLKTGRFPFAGCHDCQRGLGNCCALKSLPRKAIGLIEQNHALIAARRENDKQLAVDFEWFWKSVEVDGVSLIGLGAFIHSTPQRRVSQTKRISEHVLSTPKSSTMTTVRMLSANRDSHCLLCRRAHHTDRFGWHSAKDLAAFVLAGAHIEDC
jgi:hypothetical protein